MGLYELIAEPVDRALKAAAMGYRRGYSVQTAAAGVRELIGAGYRYAVTADIEDFFPSIDLTRLETLLDEILPPSDRQLRKLLHQLLHAGYLGEDGLLHSRVHGLAQGSP